MKKKETESALNKALRMADEAMDSARSAASHLEDAENALEDIHSLIEDLDVSASHIVREAIEMAMPMLIAKYGHSSREVKEAEGFIAK